MATPGIDSGEEVTHEMIYKRLEKMELRQGLESVRMWGIFFSSLLVAYTGLSFADEKHQWAWIAISCLSGAISTLSILIYITGMRAIVRAEELEKKGV